MSGKLFLIPTVLSDDAMHVIPTYVHDITQTLNYFFVEHEKTARRYLRKSGYKKSFDDVFLFPLNEHTTEQAKQTTTEVYRSYINYLLSGNDCGMLSEAGVPAVADPGSEVVKLCHENNIQVVPLCGPSSIILALMASGLNGQRFCFHGYIPIKHPERIKKILAMEQKAKSGETQIFIETPYRNSGLVTDVLNTCSDNTFFCIASDLTGTKEFVKTKTIAAWKKANPSLGKTPAIFLIG
jgi:16S rRNA (cytidine1402-2'-O)-methyltransferase